MANQSFRRREKVVDAYTESDLLDNFVGIFGIEVIVDSINRFLPKIFWRDLNQIGDLCLQDC